MSLGQNIQRLRKLRGLSQEQLSELLGVTRQAISKWENDESLPDAIKLGQLAQALGVTADELLGTGTTAHHFSQEFEQCADTAYDDTYQEERDLRGPIGWLIRQARKRGHYFGYLMIVWGVIGFVLTRLFHFIASSMFDPFGNTLLFTGMDRAFSAPILFADVIGILCLIVAVAGIVVAVYLKSKNKNR